jgi:Na+/H+ antiporter NhaA
VPLILVVNRVRVWRGPVYFVTGLALWAAMHESGVHPTIAGVILGVLIAVFPPSRGDVERAARVSRSFRQAPTAGLARSAQLSVTDSVSPNERLQTLLHPWTSYVIVPIFALANAGVALDGEMLERAISSPVTLGVVFGLVVGKLVGITVVSLAVARLGLGTMPASLGRMQLTAGAALAGIGFTVASSSPSSRSRTPSCARRRRSASWPPRCSPRSWPTGCSASTPAGTATRHRSARSSSRGPSTRTSTTSAARSMRR